MMVTFITRKQLSGIVLLVAALILAMVNAPVLAHNEATTTSQPAAAVPVEGSTNANLASSLAPAAATVTIDLCATSGTVTMPDASTHTIWGFAQGSCANPATLPGPTIRVTAGDTVNVNLTNDLAENVSLVFPGQTMVPDTDGVAPGGTTTYSFIAGNPGTYLYESGASNRAIQVAMGLYGALIVDPLTAGQAYNGAHTAYDEEALLVLSEIDPNLNANPAGFNMLDYKPTYWLINGMAYPDTAPITADPGENLLLRYANAGSINHAMSLIGAHQTVVATDAFPERNPYDLVGQTIFAGQTADMIVSVPAAAGGRSLPLYNRHQHVTNGDTFPGGMMTFVEVREGVNFNDYAIGSYGGSQDSACSGPVTVEDNGSTLHLVGNCWKKIAYPYTVTPNTVIEFDFMSNVQGEVHGIGFDTDDTINNPIQVFQVYGSQNWGLTNHVPQYGGAGWQHITVYAGQYFTGAMTHLTFANDDDAAGVGESLFRNVRVYEQPPLQVEVGGVMNDYAVDLYGGGQNTAGSAIATVEDGGSTLRITGNGWRKVALSYSVTANTVLEFDFQSSVEGEIHGIGFDTDDAISNTTTYQLHGTQTWGLQGHNDYAGETPKHYVINVGADFTGSYLYLVFANDDDGAASGESVFSNVQLYEGP